ncbi:MULTISPECIES: hypothetical protein [unclassified Streptomyces]|uniref:hypothetical protein n=1 Tax=unclassified Streptomyces TaxID=2593676 RepID=UPI00109ED726|nr:hypothetical protein [Streptomyces sp. A1136]THA58729.1 hypothetical protein E6R62_02455 [Streptomyces sp. A1136]
MIRTQYYVEKTGTPFFCGPDELMFLGEWVTADIQLSPLSVLEAIDLVAEAKANPNFAPEDLDGNAHTVTISTQGVRVENFFVDHVQGDYTLDDAFRVLVDFWDYCCQANPGKADARRRQYAEEHGRDPLAGIRDFLGA